MRKLIGQIWLVLLGAALAAPLQAEPPQVVSSIRPLHLLVEAVAGGAVDSQVLLPVEASPHHFQLRPSDVRQLREADLVFWVGPELERFLSRPLARLPQAVMLMEPLPTEKHRQAASGHRHHEHLVDPHIWMGLPEIHEISRTIETHLAELLPEQRQRLAANRSRLLAELQALDSEFAERLAPVRERRYLLVHEGFGYFERHYGLSAAAVVSDVAEQPPGARHVNELRRRLQRGDFDCVFREKNQSPRVLDALLRDVDVPVLELDALGAGVDEGGEGFVEFYRRLGETFAACG